MKKLYNAGVPVRQDGNPRTFHHKVFVIDEEIVVTGSFNFSENADKNNDENVIVIHNATIAEQYLKGYCIYALHQVYEYIYILCLS